MLLNEDRARSEVALRQARRAAKLRAVTVSGAVVTRYDVDDATDRIGAIERGALWPANHLDALDRVRAQLGEQEWVRDLDAIDVDLGIAHLERAGTAQAAVLRGETRWRLVPHPDTGNQAVERL